MPPAGFESTIPESVWLQTQAVYCGCVKVKVKVKFTLEQAAKAQRWSRGITLLFP
jgi:hypothetical protein